MYAMLTGTLPFTVEPFSLRALYQKMVDKEMNPLPTQLSTGNAPATADSGFQGFHSKQFGSSCEAVFVFVAMVLGLPHDCRSLPRIKAKS